ncbi:MAG: ABC transporter ATP-binding protein [Alistipes sp.]|nr:ABC transporter ATP-binding protein [Candidatus Minthomonas equi]
MMNRIQEDIRVLVELICTRIPYIIVTVCQLIAASIFLVMMAPGLLTLLIVLMMVGLLGSKMFYKTQRRLTDSIRNQDSESLEHVQESLQNRAMVLSLSGIDSVKEKFSSILDKFKTYYVKRLNYTSIARSLIGFGFMAGYTIAFLWGIFGIRDGVVTYGMMTAFLQLVGQVQRPLADLSKHVPAFIQAMSSEERLSELEALPKLVLADGPVLDEAPSLVFENVSFLYPGKTVPVFSDFSHSFNAGTLTVIMGSTGRGKSTLARLAMGLLQPRSGVVFLKLSDGRSVSAAIGNFMYVPQGGSLLSGTVRENLILAAPDADEERMRQALHIAMADFVYDLPSGLDTLCGENGSSLSVGQAQRISIARALLHPGTVLILDEATSALDSSTEATLLEHLVSEYRNRKTILMITHRKCALSYADEILCLD